MVWDPLWFSFPLSSFFTISVSWAPVCCFAYGGMPALTNNGFESGFHICNAAYHFNCNLQGTTISTQREAYFLIYGAVHTCGIMPLNKNAVNIYSKLHRSTGRPSTSEGPFYLYVTRARTLLSHS